MGTTLKDKMAGLDADHRAEVEKEATRLRDEYLTLRDLRKALDLTQVQLAEALGHRQVSIAKLERRTDLLLSTLRRHVEAMGGELDLVARFPNRPALHLRGLGEPVEKSIKDRA